MISLCFFSGSKTVQISSRLRLMPTGAFEFIRISLFSNIRKPAPAAFGLLGTDTQFLVDIPETEYLPGQLKITDVVHFIRRHIAMIVTFAPSAIVGQTEGFE